KEIWKKTTTALLHRAETFANKAPTDLTERSLRRMRRRPRPRHPAVSAHPTGLGRDCLGHFTGNSPRSMAAWRNRAADLCPPASGGADPLSGEAARPFLHPAPPPHPKDRTMARPHRTFTERRRRKLALKVPGLELLEPKQTITEPISVAGLSLSALRGLVQL